MKSAKQLHRAIKQSRRGQRFGNWTLLEKLGAGGNGEVWRASRSGHSNAAIKLLRRIDNISYERFKAEITALESHKDIDGVIQIIEYDFPNLDTQQPPWYVMPIGVPLMQFIEGKNILNIIELFATLADTLRALHGRGVSHRDIKPQNILGLNDRLQLSDFGLVKFPDRKPITPVRRDVGPKFTMAPEMRRYASQADGIPADVFSFAKTLWIALTGREQGFDGQYSAAASDLALKNFMPGIYTTTLDQLLSESTCNDPTQRPSIEAFRMRLVEWLKLTENFHEQNRTEWTELMQVLFPLGTPEHAKWTDIDAICVVLNEIGKVSGLNHMFYPTGGGNTVTRAWRAVEDGFIAIEALGTSILKPKKLTFESFASLGLDTSWNYFRLEAQKVDATGICSPFPGEARETLTELEPGNYGHPDLYYYEGDGELPASARLISRFLGGSFVIFGTRSPYNLDPATYDARHNKLDEQGFREYILRKALNHR